MRIWVQPDLMRQYALPTSDIAAAIGEQNSQFAAGQIGAPGGTESAGSERAHRCCPSAELSDHSAHRRLRLGQLVAVEPAQQRRTVLADRRGGRAVHLRRRAHPRAGSCSPRSSRSCSRSTPRAFRRRSPKSRTRSSGFAARPRSMRPRRLRSRPPHARWRSPKPAIAAEAEAPPADRSGERRVQQE